MARYKLQGRARDTWGNAISGLDIYVYISDTSRTQTAYVYNSKTTTTGTSAAPQLTTDAYGTFKFWVDDTDYTASTTKFDVYADGLEYTYIDIFNIKNHSILSGLPRNDHPQYAVVSAGEVVTGAWYFSTPASGATPSAGMHLVNKDYVDTSVASISAGEGLVESPANVLNVNPGNGIEILFDAVVVKEDEITHANISGLGTDDHTQYSRVDGTRAFTGAVGGITPTADEHLVTKLWVDSNFPSASIPSAGGPVIVTNNWYFTVPASGVSPSADSHLAIKQYVDNAVLSVSAGGGLIEPTPNVFAVNPDNTTIQIVSDEVAVIQGGLDHANIQNIGTNTHAEIDSLLSSIETSAADINSTLDSHIASASVHVSQTYIDNADASTLSSANSYTDAASASLISYSNAASANALVQANSYTDTQVLSISAGGGLIEPIPNTFAVNPASASIIIINDQVAVKPDILSAHNFSLPVSGQTPILDNHLATKLYIDNVQTLDTINGSETIVNGTSGGSIVFDTTQFDTIYSVVGNLVNVTDDFPSIYGHIITEKTTSGFTVLFSGEMDSGNYIFDWILSRMDLESSTSSSSTSSSSSSSLSSSSSSTLVTEDLLEINDGGDLLEINDGGDLLIINPTP